MAVNITKLDLNLLVLFNALMEERSVSGAALRINVTQPAASNALKRLRLIVNDPLFVRGNGGFSPTPRALEMAGPVADALKLLEMALSPRFEPSESDLTFRLAISDQTAITVLPRLVELVAELAPGIRLHAQPKRLPPLPGISDSPHVDLSIGYFETVPRHFCRQLLYTDRYVCMMPKDHPLASYDFSLGDYAAARHLAVRSVAQPYAIIDTILEANGYQRSVSLALNQFLKVPQLIAKTGLILSLFETLVEHLPDWESYGLVVRPLPVHPIPIEIVWHESMSRHRSHQWLCQQVVRVCRDMLQDINNDALGYTGVPVQPQGKS